MAAFTVVNSLTQESHYALKPTGQIIHHLLPGASFFCTLRSHWQETMLGATSTASQKVSCFCFMEPADKTPVKKYQVVTETVPDRRGSFLAPGEKYIPNCKA